MTSEVHSVSSPNLRCLQCDLLLYIPLTTGNMSGQLSLTLIQPNISQHSLNPHMQRLFFFRGALSEKISLHILELKFSYSSVPMNTSQFGSNYTTLSTYSIYFIAQRIKWKNHLNDTKILQGLWTKDRCTASEELTTYVIIWYWRTHLSYIAFLTKLMYSTICCNFE